MINCILRCLCSCICRLATHFDIYLVFILSFSTMLYNLLYDNLKKTHHWDNELRLIHHCCSFLSLVVSTSPPTSLIVQEMSTRLRVKTYSSSINFALTLRWELGQFIWPRQYFLPIQQNDCVVPISRIFVNPKTLLFYICRSWKI